MNSRSAGSSIQRSRPAAQPLGDEVERVLLADEQPGTDHLRQRPVAHALAVGQAAPGVPEDVAGEAVDVLEELPRQARLADAGDARDEHEPCGVAVGGAVEVLLDEAKVVVTAEKRCLEHTRALRARHGRDDPGRLEEPDRGGLALQLVLAGVDVGDRGRRRRPRHLVDVAAAGRGCGLDARRGVDPVADDEALLRSLGRGDAAGDDADPSLEIGPALRAVAGDGGDELEAGPDRPLGVVLLRDRGAPDRHDGVADELLHDASVPVDDGPGELEVTGEEIPYFFGIVALGERREADQVAEEDRHVPQLGARFARRHGRRAEILAGDGRRRGTLAAVHRRTADPAEGLARRHEGAARATGARHRRAALLAELTVGRDLRITRRAAHVPSRQARAAPCARASIGAMPSASAVSPASAASRIDSSRRPWRASHSARSSWTDAVQEG